MFLVDLPPGKHLAQSHDNIYLFLFLLVLSPVIIWPLTIVVVEVGRQHVYLWQGFCNYEPGWLPIR